MAPKIRRGEEGWARSGHGSAEIRTAGGAAPSNEGPPSPPPAPLTAAVRDVPAAEALPLGPVEQPGAFEEQRRGEDVSSQRRQHVERRRHPALLRPPRARTPPGRARPTPGPALPGSPRGGGVAGSATTAAAQPHRSLRLRAAGRRQCACAETGAGLCAAPRSAPGARCETCVAKRAVKRCAPNWRPRAGK